MVTAVGTEAKLNDLLINLIELDYDSVESYQAAINRLRDTNYKKQLEIFYQDHLRHIENLSKYLIKKNVTPPKGPDMKQFITKGKVVIANLFGDKAILLAMKTNEKDTNTAYERAIRHQETTPEILQTLKNNLQDEKKHWQWFSAQIDNL